MPQLHHKRNSLGAEREKVMDYDWGLTEHAGFQSYLPFFINTSDGQAKVSAVLRAGHVCCRSSHSE